MALERDHLQEHFDRLTIEAATLRARLDSARFADQAAALNISLEQVEAELRQTSQRIIQIDDRARADELIRNEQHQVLQRQAEREELAFWFRRFFTTLAIANGAAFAALASGLLQADDPVKLAPVAGPAMDAFIWGALWAGSIPLWMWAQLAMKGLPIGPDRAPAIPKLIRAGRTLMSQLMAVSAAASVIMFCLGLFTAAGAVHGLAEGKKVADAKVTAESEARVHAPPPAPTASR